MSKSSPYVQKLKQGESTLWQDREPLLAMLGMELTERCNNNCIHCCINQPADDESLKRQELTTGEIQEILVEAASLGVLTVQFTGGEPLLRDDFKEIYLFARRLGMKVMLFTNARRITPNISDLFVRIPPLELMEVTVYGMTKKSYEAVTRAAGSFDEFRRGVDLLLANKIPFVVKGALLPPNQHERDSFERWAATIPWMFKKPQYSMFFEQRHRRDDPAKQELIARVRVRPEQGVQGLPRGGEKCLNEVMEFCSKFMRPSGDKLFSCGAGHRISIDAYGKVQACIPMRAPWTVYDLHSGSLRDALTNFFPKLRETVATNPGYLERCARCFLKSLCEQCPAKSYAENGTLDTPVEYFCEVAHAQACALGLLSPGEKSWEVRDWQERVQRNHNGADKNKKPLQI